MSRHPEILWAQRSSSTFPGKNIIYFTINLPGIVQSSPTYTLTSTSISFKASTSTAGGEQIKYEFDLELFAEVDPEQSTRRLTSRSLFAVLLKKEAKLEYWPRLTKDKLERPIKKDFSRWVDEDEQDGNPNIDDDFRVGGIPGMDDGMGGMGGMGVMSAMGGMDFEKMMAQTGDSSGAGAKAEVTESDSDEDGPPSLVEPEPTK